MNDQRRWMRTFTWMPREPDVFGQPTRPKSLEHLAHDARDLLQLRPLDARHRIEVDAQLVRMIEILGAHRMRVELEAAEVRHPRQRGRVARHDLLRRRGRTESAARRPRSSPAAQLGARFW